MLSILPNSDSFLRSGQEVQGKYSADLFVQRAQTIFKAHQKDAQKGKETQPWFTYLSFQSVHEPLQVNSKTSCISKRSRANEHLCQITQEEERPKNWFPLHYCSTLILLYMLVTLKPIMLPEIHTLLCLIWRLIDYH